MIAYHNYELELVLLLLLSVPECNASRRLVWGHWQTRSSKRAIYARCDVAVHRLYHTAPPAPQCTFLLFFCTEPTFGIDVLNAFGIDVRVFSSQSWALLDFQDLVVISWPRLTSSFSRKYYPHHEIPSFQFHRSCDTFNQALAEPVSLLYYLARARIKMRS